MVAQGDYIPFFCFLNPFDFNHKINKIGILLTLKKVLEEHVEKGGEIVQCTLFAISNLAKPLTNKVTKFFD